MNPSTISDHPAREQQGRTGEARSALARDETSIARAGTDMHEHPPGQPRLVRCASVTTASGGS